IAFTSQLAHAVSSAYIKSPAAIKHKGFSAGSYRDLTRVAKLNEDMWTELFLDNSDYLAEEIDGIADRLKEYSAAIKAKDGETLRSLLKDGREKKAMIDGEIF
ncbi:prephenate dehydrogenase/arogenate dehydrogenase family protein, partial [Intestinibacillus massiliensis]|nr:prephenate dehydrogenase/arogenate dehydrogenase family protein [Intestinibacillus massiliensis]